MVTPLFAMCSMNINNSYAAAVQLQQCTRGQHHGTSCGQGSDTHNPTTTDKSTATVTAHVYRVFTYYLL